MTVTVQAAADRVDTATLQTLLQQLARQFGYMILANTQDCIFENFSLPQARDLQRWPTGQAFGSISELRWRPKGDQFAVCFIIEKDALPEPVSNLAERETLAVEVEDLKIRLWGEHREDDGDTADRPVWIEAQIPRLLTYPIAQPPTTVALKVRRYQQADKTVALVRFAELVDADKSED